MRSFKPKQNKSVEEKDKIARHMSDSPLNVSDARTNVGLEHSDNFIQKDNFKAQTPKKKVGKGNEETMG